MAQTYATIQLGSQLPLSFKQGTIPDVSGALYDYFQTMTFGIVTKTVVAGQADETVTNVTFQGLIMPYSPRELQLLPEGQRSWSFYHVFAQPVLSLQTDDIVLWNNWINGVQVPVQMRCMFRENYDLYGWIHYRMCQDWINSGPPTP